MSLKGKRVVVVGGTSDFGLSAAIMNLPKSLSQSKLSEAKKVLGSNVETYTIDFAVKKN